MKTVYVVWYGNEVPYQDKEFTSWKDAAAFIKRCLDNCTFVHSISKEVQDDAS